MNLTKNTYKFFLFLSVIFTTNLEARVIYSKIDVENTENLSNKDLVFNLEESRIQLNSNDEFVRNGDRVEKIISKQPTYTIESIPNNKLALGIKILNPISYDLIITPKYVDNYSGLLEELNFKTVTIGQEIWNKTKEILPAIIAEVARRWGNPVAVVAPIEPTPMPSGEYQFWDKAGNLTKISSDLLDIEKTKCIHSIGQPIKLDLLMKPSRGEYTEHYLGKNSEQCISIIFSDISKSTVIPVDQIKYGVETTDFYKSICRKAKLIIKQLPGMDPIEKEIIVADPNFVEIIPMPKNGKIKKKSGCGYTV